MTKILADQLTFRKWLVKQLTVSRWSAPLDESEADLAARLGVQVAVLREAKALRDQELKKRSRSGLALGSRRYIGHDYAEIRVWMPRSIWKDWVEVCKTLRVESGTALRSVLHAFLLDPKRPTSTAQAWVYRGKKVVRLPKDVGIGPKTRIPRGAQIALDHHADSWGVSPSAVVRGAVIDFLEGRVRRIKMVAFAELWGDPDRYLKPEEFKR